MDLAADIFNFPTDIRNFETLRGFGIPSCTIYRVPKSEVTKMLFTEYFNFGPGPEKAL